MVKSGVFISRVRKIGMRGDKKYKCKDVEVLIVKDLLGEIRGKKEGKLLEEHLVSCSECRGKYDGLIEVWERMGGLKVEEPEVGFGDKIIGRIEEEVAKGIGKRGFGLLYLVRWVYVTFIFLLFSILGWYGGRAMWDFYSKSEYLKEGEWDIYNFDEYTIFYFDPIEGSIEEKR